MERYERIERIGEGSYGVVFRARDRHNGEIVAMKKVRLEGSREGLAATALREISVLKDVSSSEFVVNLKDVVFTADSRLYLVFEYMNADLKQYIDSCGTEGMSSALVKSYTYQMLSGLAHCHSRRVIHRDLKPQNLLIDTRGRLKLADFGLARVFGVPIRKYTHEVVTLWYRAPEILLGSSYYSTSIDIWAAAAIVAEMTNLRPLLPGDSEIDQLYRIFRLLGTPDMKTWARSRQYPEWNEAFPQFRARPLSREREFPHLEENGVDLLRRMFVYDETRRITAAEALDHPYFAPAAEGGWGDGGGGGAGIGMEAGALEGGEEQTARRRGELEMHHHYMDSGATNNVPPQQQQHPLAMMR